MGISLTANMCIVFKIPVCKVIFGYFVRLSGVKWQFFTARWEFLSKNGLNKPLQPSFYCTLRHKYSVLLLSDCPTAHKSGVLVLSDSPTAYKASVLVLWDSPTADKSTPLALLYSIPALSAANLLQRNRQSLHPP